MSSAVRVRFVLVTRKRAGRAPRPPGARKAYAGRPPIIAAGGRMRSCELMNEHTNKHNGSQYLLVDATSLNISTRPRPLVGQAVM